MGQSDNTTQSGNKHQDIGSLKEVAGVFLKLGLIAFGGPAAHVAMMEQEVVTKRKWMSRQHFLDLMGATNLIPGPNSTEMTMHCGHERAGWRGLFVAGFSFILPAVLLTGLLAYLYVEYGQVPEVAPFLVGIKPAVLAIILGAVYKLGKKALKNWELGVIGAGVVAAALLGLSEIAAILGAGGLGLLWLGVLKRWYLARGQVNAVDALDSGAVDARDSKAVDALDSGAVDALGSKAVDAQGSGAVDARDSGAVDALDSKAVDALDSGAVDALDSKAVDALGSGAVDALDSKAVDALGSGAVDALDSKAVDALGSGPEGSKDKPKKDAPTGQSDSDKSPPDKPTGNNRKVYSPFLLLGSATSTLAAIPLGKLFLVFLKVGAILFGSGYVLVAYLDHELVDQLGWLSKPELLDAIAIGQFTPGPVLSTATFVGYQLQGVEGAILATVGIFLPSFLFVLLLNPLVPKLRKSKLAGAFLDGVNIGALGIMVAVMYRLGENVLVDWRAWVIAGVAVVVTFQWKKVGSFWIVIGGMVLGWLLGLV